MNPQKATRLLRGPAGEPLKVLGQFVKKITHTKTKSLSSEMIYIIQGLKSNLLEFPAIQNLHLIKCVDSVGAMNSIKQWFAKVFEELGTLRNEYHIQLKEDAIPYSLYTSRNVTLPLQEKVK